MMHPQELPESVPGRSRERCNAQENISDLRSDVFRKPAEQLILGSKRFWPKWLRSGKGSLRRRRAERVNNTFEVPRQTLATRGAKLRNDRTHAWKDRHSNLMASASVQPCNLVTEPSEPRRRPKGKSKRRAPISWNQARAFDEFFMQPLTEVPLVTKALRHGGTMASIPLGRLCPTGKRRKRMLLGRSYSDIGAYPTFR
jgi:hypothetical protein